MKRKQKKVQFNIEMLESLKDMIQEFVEKHPNKYPSQSHFARYSMIKQMEREKNDK